jgi:hypothetical protein
MRYQDSGGWRIPRSIGVCATRSVIYYPFILEHSNIQDRLRSNNIDSVVFAAEAEDSIANAVNLLLAKFGIRKP